MKEMSGWRVMWSAPESQNVDTVSPRLNQEATWFQLAGIEYDQTVLKGTFDLAGPPKQSRLCHSKRLTKNADDLGDLAALYEWRR
jgi:hypothetical protein